MPLDPDALAGIRPHAVFDGGDLDCGSGLALLIRERVLGIPQGAILELRSREPTVADDLPPWCRLSGHEYLGTLDAGGFQRHFVRRGSTAAEDTEALERDKSRAKAFAWRVRARATGGLESTVYFRNFSFKVGQAASFEEKDAHPSAVEYVLGALAGTLATGLRTECSSAGIEVDDVEVTAAGRLANVLGAFGMEEGDPSFEVIEVKGFVSSLAEESTLREAWERAVVRSPLCATLRKATRLELKLSIV